MRIFSQQQDVAQKTVSTRNIEKDIVREDAFNYSDKIAHDPRIKKYGKPSISETEIRQKFQEFKLKKEEEARKAAIESAKHNALKKQEMEDRVAAGEEAKPPGDVSINDPTDPNTRSKLREAVQMGTFNFSQKEREVLNQILKKEN